MRDRMEQVKRLVALVAFFTVMGTAVADASEPVGQIVQFDSAARGVTEKVSGYLSFPSYASGKVPLMLVLHSTGGIGSRDWDIVRKLNAMGVATFVVDSFGSRNLKDVYKNKLAFNQREQLIDALSALKTLQADDRIDTTRLGSMGRSMGGETSLRLTLKASRDRLPIQAPAIALALAITPGCMAQERDATMTAGSEAHFFLADKDFSPYEQCVGYAQKMNKDAKSNNKAVSYKIYHGTFHVFDQWQKPVWSADQEVYAGCPIERYGSGHLVRRDTHQELRTKAEQDRFYRDCVTHGGWVGGSPERVTELDRDWSRLVDRRFFVP